MIVASIIKSCVKRLSMRISIYPMATLSRSSKKSRNIQFLFLSYSPIVGQRRQDLVG